MNNICIKCHKLKTNSGAWCKECHKIVTKELENKSKNCPPPGFKQGNPEPYRERKKGLIFSPNYAQVGEAADKKIDYNRRITEGNKFWRGDVQ
jgi:hypothetical protein